MFQDSKSSVQSTESGNTKRGNSSSKYTIIIVGVLMLVGAVTVAVAVPLSTQKSDKSKSLDDAIAILDQAPVFDGHNDWPWQMRKKRQNVFNNISLHDDFTQYFTPSHTDIPRLRKGRVGAQFWVCYTSCTSLQKDAVRQGLEQMDVITRMMESEPDTFVLARTSSDIENANAQGKIASLIGVEGGHMIDSSLAALRMYYKLGGRYMSPTHSCNTPWAGASGTDQGLSDFGKLVIHEMNRLGMLIDLSHVSDQVMNDVLDMTQAPIMFSHSSARAICDHPRNVPDDVLKRIPENNGIVMINFYPGFVTCNSTATTEDVADHFDYIRNFIGVDYIGIGGDYDGIPSVPDGLEDVSKYPNLIAELLMRGWSDEELRKISRENMLRVMREVENVAAAQQSTKPGEEWIPDSDVSGIECRT